MDAGIGGVLLMKANREYTFGDGSKWRPFELDHICCCQPDVAMCGAVVAGTGVAFGKSEGSRNLCRKCADLDASGKRCSEPGCPGTGE